MPSSGPSSSGACRISERGCPNRRSCCVGVLRPPPGGGELRVKGSVMPNKRWTIVLASLGVFMTALDTLVVTTSLPALRLDLHASLQSLEWTVNAYNLAFACFLLTGATLGDRFGRRRMYTVGLLTFTAASAAAALSPSAGSLIAARAVQGAGAAIVFPLTLTLISEAFPAEKRGAAIGLWGGITGLGVAIGPVVGGAVVSGISWHWIFWLNVPVGIVLIPLAATRLTESFGPRPQLDILGLLLAAAGAFGVTWGLIRANTAGWGSGEVVGSLLAGAAFAAAFLRWERSSESPMIPVGLFRAARGGGSRLRDQQHDPRARRCARRGGARHRVRPPRRLLRAADVRRRVRAGAVGRGRVLGRGHAGRAARCSAAPGAAGCRGGGGGRMTCRAHAWPGRTSGARPARGGAGSRASPREPRDALPGTR